MQHLRSKLEKRGWTYEEIKKIEESIAKAELKKRPFVKVIDNMLFLLFFLIITIGNFLLVVSLAPILISIGPGITYLMLILVALTFGFIISTVLHSFELAKHHHYISIIGSVLFSVIFIIIVNNYLDKMSGVLHSIRTPIFIVLAYCLAFITPYFLFKSYLYFKRK